MRIFGLCAEKQAGKDTFANFAIQALPNFKVEKRALATPLKKFCQDYLGLSEASCFGSEAEKNTGVGVWSDFFPTWIAEKYGKPTTAPISGREILQIVGTDIFRENFSHTFWLDLMLNRTIPAASAAGVNILFVTDVRFHNEVCGLQQAGAKIIRLYRSIERVQQISHPSELEMATIPEDQFDYVITPDKDTTMKVLRETTIEILKKEGLLP